MNTDMNYPTLPARHTGVHLRVWCRYCNREHLHGAGVNGGHRLAHCASDTPYLRGDGYILEPCTDDEYLTAMSRAAWDATDASQGAEQLAVLAHEGRDLIGDGWHGWRSYREDARAALIALEKLQRHCAKCVAEPRGWKLSKRPFYLSDLLPGRALTPGYVDALVPGKVSYLDCFRAATKPYKPVAAVCHCSYVRPEAIAAFAKTYKLQCTILSASWYSKSATAALFTRADR